jgi:hypothetical protein
MDFSKLVVVEAFAAANAYWVGFGSAVAAPLCDAQPPSC